MNYVGASTSVLINGVSVLNFTDPSPLPHGTAGLFVDGAAVFTALQVRRCPDKCSTMAVIIMLHVHT